MKKHPLLVVATIAALAVAAALGLSLILPADEQAPVEHGTSVISLSPPITETLFEIGAGDQVAGRSDYCDFPPQARGLPACGTALHANAEAIIRLRAGLIIADQSQGTKRGQISQLGNAAFVPWLTAEDVISSTRELGRLTGHVEEANRLADDLAAALSRRAPADAPRVLLVMTPTPGKLGPITFFRRNSIHGRMLEAAGGRNAADFDVTGVPVIGVERVIELDPDMIIVLVKEDDMPAAKRAQIVTDWGELSVLRAVKERRVGVINGEHLYGAGRRLLRAIDDLHAEIGRLRPHD
jgi:iron complex transport system substrate-binding protein